MPLEDSSRLSFSTTCHVFIPCGNAFIPCKTQQKIVSIESMKAFRAPKFETHHAAGSRISLFVPGSAIVAGELTAVTSASVSSREGKRLNVEC